MPETKSACNDDCPSSEEAPQKNFEDECQRLVRQLDGERKRLEIVIQQIPAGVVLAEAPGGRILLTNERVAEILRHDVPQIDEIGDYRRWNAIHPDGTPYEPEEIPLVRVVTNGEVIQNEEMEYLAGDGTQITLSINAAPIKDEDGRIVAGILTFVDISERKHAERERVETISREREARANAEAAEQRARFLSRASTVLGSSLDYETTLKSVARLIVPTVADWCFVDIIGPDGELHRLAVAHADPAKERLAQEIQQRYPPEPVTPKGARTVVRSGKSLLVADLTDSMLMSAARDEHHLTILQNLAFNSFMCVPLRVREQIFGVISLVSAESKRSYGPDDLAFAEDLADRASLAIDNARLYRDAREASRAKDEFLATLSHELRTPLNSMIGWCQMLRRGGLDQETLDIAITTIDRNARAQAQLIEDILDVSRIISGKFRLNVGRLDLVRVVEAAIDGVRPAAEAKDIDLKTSVDPAVGLVLGDAERLQQVSWNLLSNAVKFTPKGGHVQVSFERLESMIEMTVADTGVGISREFLPFVFDRFRQANATTTRRYGGLGIGLAIVRQIVEMHGGTIHAESRGEGFGSSFIVRLPLAAPDAEPIPKLERRVMPSALKGTPTINCPDVLNGLRVLAVDDEEDTRGMLDFVLSSCKADVRTVGSVQEALDTIREWKPDMLISDIGMPDEDGYSLIRKLRVMAPEQGGQVPAIALTAYARVEDRLKVLAAGYQMHVPKPVEPAELIAIIASLVGRSDQM